MSVKIITDITSMSVDKTYEIICKSTGSIPPAEITWWKSGRKLTGAKEFVSRSIYKQVGALPYIQPSIRVIVARFRCNYFGFGQIPVLRKMSFWQLSRFEQTLDVNKQKDK